jgi:hypothetical protein
LLVLACVVPVGCRFRLSPFVNSDESGDGERHRTRQARDKEGDAAR